jgi:hypothetical protein
MPLAGFGRRAVFLSAPLFFQRMLPMFYVICPTCQAKVEIPADAIGPDRTDLYNVTSCDECGTGFDYDDEEVMNDGTQTTA